jgi:hypothetical protein
MNLNNFLIENNNNLIKKIENFLRIFMKYKI